MSLLINKCLVCSAKLPRAKDRGHHRLYCSDACRVRAQRRRKRVQFVNALAAEEQPQVTL
jgi:predicted nucleic acid-binding Zn ribbon protein